MEDIEIWKEISNYDNYKISSFGNVKNNNTFILKSFSFLGSLWNGFPEIYEKDNNTIFRPLGILS